MQIFYKSVKNPQASEPGNLHVPIKVTYFCVITSPVINQITGITQMNKDPLASCQKEKKKILWQGIACEENTGVSLSDMMFSGVKKKKKKL